jgi:3-dehydroquinate synthase
MRWPISSSSCKIKAEVVAKDERESGLRAILNYGHTIGHAIETLTGYTHFLHGEAVAIGMRQEAMLSHLLGFIAKEQVMRIKAVIDAYGLPSEIPPDVSADSLLASMQLDKKTVAGQLKFILLKK